MKYITLLLAISLAGWMSSIFADASAAREGGQGKMLDVKLVYPGSTWATRTPAELGLDPKVTEELKNKVTEGRWALWRYGYLVHVEGDFNERTEVKSLRKTWHALTVGAAIKQGKIPSYHQKVSVWNKELTGKDAEATWWHVMTQSAGFDYPYNDYSAYEPGEMWTYSDLNPVHLCNALARVYGKRGFRDNYDDVIREAYFNAIGMKGWSTSVVFDHGSQMEDGIRFHFDLENMGRLGLLVLARGKWNGVEVIPQWFVEELETKRTYGMQVNYNGPNDGKVNLDPEIFPECPYGYMTWVNTDGDYYPGADKAWAWGAGAGGTYILWNHKNGIVFAAVGRNEGPAPISHGIPQIIEANITSD
jgi:CubicO group peptidase (beta-lactamase class C family)